jgi:hypothetical protein
MPNDEKVKSGAIAPPPLIYLATLIFGLLLNRRIPTASLPRRVARSLGWPLLGGGVLLIGWFERTMRHAGTPDNPYKPVEHAEEEATNGPPHLGAMAEFGASQASPRRNSTLRVPPAPQRDTRSRLHAGGARVPEDRDAAAPRRSGAPPLGSRPGNLATVPGCRHYQVFDIGRVLTRGIHLPVESLKPGRR